MQNCLPMLVRLLPEANRTPINSKACRGKNHMSVSELNCKSMTVQPSARLATTVRAQCECLVVTTVIEWDSSVSWLIAFLSCTISSFDQTSSTVTLDSSATD